MLQKIKEKSSSWIVKSLLVLVSMTFVLWGTSSIWNIFLASNVLVEINGELFSPEYFENAVINYKENLVETNAARTTASERHADIAIREEVLGNIINATLIRQGATEDRVLLSNKQIDEIIVDQAGFHIDGKFSASAYNAFLQRSRTTSNNYKSYINNNYKVATYSESIEGSAFFVPSELNIYANLRYQEFNYQYLALDPANYIDKSSIEDGVLRDFYEENVLDYYSPKEYTLNYYVLSPDQLLDDIEISDLELQDAYFANYGSQLGDANITLRQIFFADEEGINRGLEAAMEEVKQQIRTENDFIRLASNRSQDAQTATQGGLLGEVLVGDLPTAFVDAIGRADARNKLLGPVRTNLGVHLLWVVESPDVEIPSIDDVEEDLLVDLRYSKVEEEALLKAENFSYEILTLNDLDQAAANLGIEGGKTKTFTIGDGFAERFGQVLIEEVLVMNAGDTSDVLLLDNGDYMAISLLDVEEEKLQLFVDIRQQIEDDYRLAQATEMIKELANQIVANIESGKQTYAEVLSLIPAKNARARRAIKWTEILGHSRSSDTEQLGGDLAFSLPKGVFPYGSSRYNGELVEIVLVDALIDKTYNELSTADKLILRGEYLDNFRSALNALVVASLRDRADIEIDEELAGVR